MPIVMPYKNKMIQSQYQTQYCQKHRNERRKHLEKYRIDIGKKFSTKENHIGKTIHMKSRFSEKSIHKKIKIKKDNGTKNGIIRIKNQFQKWLKNII